MSGLHINYEPRMTAALVEAGAFRDDPFTIVDVGARGGVADYWSVFGSDLRLVGFELDPAECERLAALDKRTTFLPHALDREAGERRVIVTEYASCSSFYQLNPVFMGRHTTADLYRTVEEPVLKTVSLAQALEGVRPDFIKLDAEGAELGILQGGQELLSGIAGILSEVRFSKSMADCPLFWEMEQFVRAHGFDLYDLDVARVSKRALPYPYLYNIVDEAGRPVAGPSIQGQPLWADVLYLRDLVARPASRRQVLATACLLEIFGLSDCAAELVLKHRALFDELVPADRLLDALVPTVKDRRLGYREYMARDLVSDDLLRPALRTRFPEQVISQYDGTFRPAWQPPMTFWQRLKFLFQGG